MKAAALDDRDQIRFTAEFRLTMGELGWEARAFVGHLLGLWYDPFEHMLDFTGGEAHLSADQPGTYDRNDLDGSQDVVEYWAEIWSRNGKYDTLPHEAGAGLGLDTDRYRDMLRAKLVSLRIPKRLLSSYKEEVLARHRRYSV